MSEQQVGEPIINDPYEEPREHWEIREHEPAILRSIRRPAVYWPDMSGKIEPIGWVEPIRRALAEWRQEALRGGGGVTRVTMELLRYWRREGREHRLFFAQIEAAETVIFLTEARDDYLQGIKIPRDDPGEEARQNGVTPFRRYCCKLATGGGKTTVMAMLAAWSVLNKTARRGDARFSDAVLIVCPNVTIRDRLGELDPRKGEVSIYRARDLVPERLMPQLCQGKVLTTNWHVFEPQTAQVGGVGGRVLKSGRRVVVREIAHIGKKTTMAQGKRWLTLDDYRAKKALGVLRVIREKLDNKGDLKSAVVESEKYVESDAAIVRRVLGRDFGGKQNILVINDEAHHAYRLRIDGDKNGDLVGDDEADRAYRKEATVWVDGLDRIQKARGINFCIDFSATPYYLLAAGKNAGKIFPWTVSNFDLNDAIESGLVKIPQMAVRDTTGADIPGYLNIWDWILKKLTPRERGGKGGEPNVEAILRYAHTPIAMLGGMRKETQSQWERDDPADPRPPVFIVVCKNIKLAKVVHEWLAKDKKPTGIPSAALDDLRDQDGEERTIRIDSKIAEEIESGGKSDETRWMRWTLNTVGKNEWPRDRAGREIYPDGFVELARKLGRPTAPPGRAVRCIVSVSMLTEGWDCNTVTHIIGLRPFMSQLLCEQVVGRGLRRRNYDPAETADGKTLMREEIAAVFGVPFRNTPFKKSEGEARSVRERYHIRALPERKDLEIHYPRVDGYREAVKNRLRWDSDAAAGFVVNPEKIPPQTQTMAALRADSGRSSLHGPGKIGEVSLRAFRADQRAQQRLFDLAKTLTREYAARAASDERRESDLVAPTSVLFPQLFRIARRFYEEKVDAYDPSEKIDAFLSPYYGLIVEQLLESIRADVGDAPAELPRYERARGPGGTGEVDFYTVREPLDVLKSHVNAVAWRSKLEKRAAERIDRHPRVISFVKNEGLGFGIPYLHGGQMRDYIPDFIIRLAGDKERFCVLETKGYDELTEVKVAAAQRWIKAVNADGEYGLWEYCLIKEAREIETLFVD